MKRTGLARAAALLLALVMMFTTLTACGDKSQDPNGGKKDTLVVALNGDPPTLDPHASSNSTSVNTLNPVYETLYRYDQNGDLQPLLAESYERIDETTWRFHLRQGVKFHNGEEMKASDVLYSFTRAAGPDGAKVSYIMGYIDPENCKVEDDYTIVIATKDPFPLLGYLPYIGAVVVSEKEFTTDIEHAKTHPVGTGPFKFVSRTAQESVVLERFDDYWGEKPDLTKVTYKIIENADSILLSLQSGAVDVFAHLTTTQIQQLGDGFHVEEGTMNLVQALYLNNAEKPFDDVRVRQALCYAIDRQQILDLAFNGYGTLLGSSMYPAFSKYFDDELTNYYTYNAAKAKELLTEAGYPNGFDMTITVPSNYQSHMDTAQVIVEQLKAVGINAAIQPVTWESWVQDTYSNRQFQSTVVGVDASNMTARAMLERFVSTASRDFINYNNADYDALFAQAQACYDDGEQTALYRAMEKNLAENAANVYIQDMADFVAVRDGLEGPSFYPIYVLDLSTIHYTK